jgi:predicted metal-dependent hydrolase
MGFFIGLHFGVQKQSFCTAEAELPHSTLFCFTIAPMPVSVDQIIRSKRHTIAILVHRDGKVIVRAPLKAPETLIRAFIESKSGWIEQKKAEAAQHVALPVKKYTGGEKFLYLGREIPLRVVDGQKTALTFRDEFSLSKTALPGAQALFEKWYKARARTVLTERVTHYAQQFGLRYEKIRISSARTCWGSCSSRGTLSFTWRLVMAPLEVVDYVVIHELAHLKVKNHSPVFWAEVARMQPDFKRRRAWLKKNGQFLTLDGA